MFAIAGCASTPTEPPLAGESDLTNVIVAEIAAARNELPVAASRYAQIAGHSSAPEVLERATRLAADAQQPRLALRAAERWIGVAPGAIEAQEFAAGAALQLHQVPLAAAHLRRVLSLEPGGLEPGYRRVGDVLGASDDVYAARRAAEQVAADHADAVPALKLVGLAQASADDSSAAVANLAKAVRAAPTSELTWALARAMALAGQEREALELANAQADRVDDANGKLQHAAVLILLHREAAAQAELESLIDAPQGGPEALRLLGRLQLQRGALDLAEECFFRLVKSGHYIGDAFYHLGRIAERRGQDDAALRLYARVEEGESVYSAMLRAAALLRRNGAVDEAEGLLDGLLADAPTRAPQILAARAQLYADVDEQRRGLALLDGAIGTYPDSVELRFKRAELLDQSQQLRAALRELDRLQKQRPDDPAALNALGYTLADHALQLPRARRLIEAAFARAPQSAAIRDSLGWVLYRQGQPQQALAHLSAAFAADRGAETGAHLGEVLWKLNQREEARRIWEQARAEDPRDKVLLATLARLNGTH